MTDAIQKTLSSLPPEIPVFPLSRVVLLPHVQLPLNIFEPRYLAMTEYALKNGRVIGMIQPREGDALFRTGCAGRIASFEETDDGRYLITLKGVCRFNVISELPVDTGGFRKVVADYAPFAGDLAPENPSNICREAMMETLKCYLSQKGMLCDQWDTMRHISCEKLVSTLAVICPFEVEEKQALLEAVDLEQRMKMLQAFLQNSICRGDAAGEKSACH